MAQMLFTELRPFLAEAQAANLPVTFGAPAQCFHNICIMSRMCMISCRAHAPIMPHAKHSTTIHAHHVCKAHPPAP